MCIANGSHTGTYERISMYFGLLMKLLIVYFGTLFRIKHNEVNMRHSDVKEHISCEKNAANSINVSQVTQNIVGTLWTIARIA